MLSGQFSDDCTDAPSWHRWFSRCHLALSPTRAANCTDAYVSVYPVLTGKTGAPASVHPVQLFCVELIHFIISLSSFFVFCFTWPFCFFPWIYQCSLDKLISLIDCGVTQSPKSQNNSLMGPCSLHLESLSLNEIYFYFKSLSTQYDSRKIDTCKHESHM